MEYEIWSLDNTVPTSTYTPPAEQVYMCHTGVSSAADIDAKLIELSAKYPNRTFIIGRGIVQRTPTDIAQLADIAQSPEIAKMANIAQLVNNS